MCRSLIVLGLLFFSAVSLAETLPNHPTYDEIIERGSIHISVYEDFPPFSYQKEGKLVGVDVELAKMIAEKLGVKAVFRSLPAGETVTDDLRHAIWKGHYLGGGITDLMMHVPTNREFAKRNEMVVIMGDYLQHNLVLARDAAKTGDTPSLAVYRYEKIGVELDSFPDFFLTGFNRGVIRHNVVHYRTVGEAAEGLKNGEISAIFASRLQLEHALGAELTNYSVDKALAPGLFNDQWNVGLAVSTTTRQLGYAIEDIVLDLVNSGAVEELYNRNSLSYTKPEW